MMLVSVKICFRGQINCQQNAESNLKTVPLFGAANQAAALTMVRLHLRYLKDGNCFAV